MLFLALGTLSPDQAGAVVAAAKQSRLASDIEINEAYPGYSIVGRYPVLQLSEHACVFGVQPVCDYLLGSATASTPAVVQGDGRSANAILSVAVRDAIFRAFPHQPSNSSSSPLPFPEVKFNEGKKSNGDYSFSNCAQLASFFKPNTPPALAQAIAAQLDLEGELAWLIKSVQVVGFYVNFFLSEAYLDGKIAAYSSSVPAAPMLRRKRVVIDFSSPNIAKEMHVGHLRSTIIGDSVSRFLAFAGHEVLKVNHVGDWGTQFGMLICYLFANVSEDEPTLLAKLSEMTLGDLTQLYKASKLAFDADEAGFKTRSRLMVVELQNSKPGDRVRNVWQRLVDVSKTGFDTVYSRLNVNFDNEDSAMTDGVGYCGESYYQPLIAEAIQSVKHCTTKRGEAVLLFTGLPEAKQPADEGNPDGEIPLFLRKSDGGFGYDSTDLAACKFRIEKLAADQVIYVTDGGQALHFQMIFKAAELAKWSTKKSCQLDHCKFGVVTAKGGGKFKTRSGDTVTLSSLMDDAQNKMRDILVQRQEDNAFSPEQLEELSQAIGMAAIKYFDLRNNRIKDYAFDAELMCSPVGDTGVYLMYCYARVCSILEKSGSAAVDLTAGAEVVPAASQRERNVALAVSRFNEVVAGCIDHLTPHPLCGYLYGLASEFSTFVTDDQERVWAKRTQPEDALKLEPGRGKQRYVLCQAMKAVLFQGLGLLGIVPFSRM